MAEQLAVEARTQTGKGPARRLRAAGKIPGIYYGRGETTTMFAVDPVVLRKTLAKTGLNTILELKSSESALQGKLALLHEVCRDPASRELKHIDLVAIDPNRAVTVRIPIHVHGKSKGVVAGGILDQVRHELEVSCLPLKIPAEIRVDVTELEIGQSIHVSDLTLPEGVTSEDEGRFTIVTIVAQKAEPTAEELAAAAAVDAPATAAPAAAAGDKAGDKKE